MPIREDRALYEWIRREEPSRDHVGQVLQFLARVDRVSWAAPSIPHPDPELSQPPESEVRVALVAPAGVRVYYWVDRPTDIVDLIWVGYGGR